MCLQTIETENIILSYFDKNKDESQVKLATLMEYVRALEKEFQKQHKSVYINYTRTSLINAILLHLDFLDLEDDVIRKLNNNKLNSKMAFYNSKLPYKIQNDYLKIFDDVDKKMKADKKKATQPEYA
jgi:hypothetical protein